jgi:hypothetical protein
LFVIGLLFSNPGDIMRRPIGGSNRFFPIMRTKNATWLAVLAVAFAPESVARASLVQALDLTELTVRADRIVVAQVVSVSSAWDAAHRNISTRIEVKVDETWKGEIPSDVKIVLVQPGGTVGDIEMVVHGMPRFVPLERTVLFLRGHTASSVVGMSQGKRALHWDDKSERWVAKPADSSAVVRRDAKGLLQPASADPPMSLDELRDLVRALVKP